jgi:hypothetical protein
MTTHDVTSHLDANLAVLRTSVLIAKRVAHLEHVDRSDSSAPHRHPSCDRLQPAIDAVHDFMEDDTPQGQQTRAVSYLAMVL